MATLVATITFLVTHTILQEKLNEDSLPFILNKAIVLFTSCAAIMFLSVFTSLWFYESKINMGQYHFLSTRLFFLFSSMAAVVIASILASFSFSKRTSNWAIFVYVLAELPLVGLVASTFPIFFEYLLK